MPEIKTMKHNSSADGLPLEILYCEAETPKGILQCCHGMTEHKERYAPLLQFMAENGYHCYLHDMRGHGKSVLDPKDLGYFYNDGANACVEDLHTINQYLREKYPDLPIFLFGHSMGSLEVRAYCKKYDDTISGLIVCGSPSYVRAVPVGKRLLRIMTLLKGDRHRSSLMSAIALGSYNKPFAGESDSPHNWVSANRENVDAYDKDPLCGFLFTLNGFSVLMDLMTAVYREPPRNLTNPDLPILFLSGEMDSCRGGDKNFRAAVEAMKSAGYPNTEFILYPGMRHEILNEKDAGTVMADILNFINR